MADATEEDRSNKAGRPVGKRGKFAFRVTADLREKLEALSVENGRPVSEEIEMRLEESFLFDRIISKVIDRSINGGAEAALKSLKDKVGGDHFFYVGLQLGELYHAAVVETATGDDKMAWIKDDEQFEAIKSIMSEGTAEWLDIIRRSSWLLQDPKLEKVTETFEERLKSPELKRMLEVFDDAIANEKAEVAAERATETGKRKRAARSK